MIVCQFCFVAGATIRVRILKGTSARYGTRYCGHCCRGYDPGEDTEREVLEDLALAVRARCRGYDPGEDTESNPKGLEAIMQREVAGATIRVRILKVPISRSVTMSGVSLQGLRSG